MKERTALEDLVRRVADGEATEAEKALFSQWMLYLDLSPVGMREMATDDLRAAMLEEILAPVALPKEGVVPRGRWYRLAPVRYVSSAAAVVVVALGLYWLSQRMRQGGTVPAGVVTLANPGKQARHFHLPDSSEVWLNSGSSLSFSGSEFADRERRVNLQGEGYFRVRKDARPFVVSAGGIDTRVLATAFNIESYPGESEVRVTLQEGKVMVEDEGHPGRRMVLAPDEVMHYSRQKDSWGVDRVEAGKVVQWIDGRLVFHELPLGEALGRMEKRYGIVFRYDSALLANKNVTANFGPKPWQQVLDDLLFVHMLAYHQKNGVIYITKQ